MNMKLQHFAEKRECVGIVCGHHTDDKMIGDVHHLNSGIGSSP